MPEAHTGVHIANVLTNAVEEWKLQPSPPVVSDNASNMVAAMKEFETSLHLGCFAHTLNLACGKALKLSTVSKLLARMRRVVAYFHRSAIATNMLKEKQELLKLPKHKLIIDVSTRWNSALDMASRFLEQQPAVYATLTSKEIRGKEKDISTLRDEDIAAAEELVSVLGPMKTATTLLCTETVPTISTILPILSHLTECMSVKEDDSVLVIDVKKAIVDNLSCRYGSIKGSLVLASLLDPRFKTVPFLTAEEAMEAHHCLVIEAISVKQKSVQVKTEKADNDVPPMPTLPVIEIEDTDGNQIEPPPPKVPKQIKSETVRDEAQNTKACSMSSFFGDVYITKVDQPKSCQEICESEVMHYRKESPISADANPLIWWKANCHKYPNLALLAKKFLGIPATSVPSERVFSTAGDIVTAQRSALKPEHVDRLIFLKKNWNPY